jgi:hypothetical protein
MKATGIGWCPFCFCPPLYFDSSVAGRFDKALHPLQRRYPVEQYDAPVKFREVAFHAIGFTCHPSKKG